MLIMTGLTLVNTRLTRIFVSLLFPNLTFQEGRSCLDLAVIMFSLFPEEVSVVIFQLYFSSPTRRLRICHILYSIFSELFQKGIFYSLKNIYLL